MQVPKNCLRCSFRQPLLNQITFEKVFSDTYLPAGKKAHPLSTNHELTGVKKMQIPSETTQASLSSTVVDDCLRESTGAEIQIETGSVPANTRKKNSETLWPGWRDLCTRWEQSFSCVSSRSSVLCFNCSTNNTNCRNDPRGRASLTGSIASA